MKSSLWEKNMFLRMNDLTVYRKLPLWENVWKSTAQKRHVPWCYEFFSHVFFSNTLVCRFWIYSVLSKFFMSQRDVFKVGLSSSKKNYFYLLQWKHFKNDEKSFLFRLKSSFCSQDIYVFVSTFWSCRRNGLIRMIRLISKYLTSQPG